MPGISAELDRAMQTVLCLKTDPVHPRCAQPSRLDSARLAVWHGNREIFLRAVEQRSRPIVLDWTVKRDVEVGMVAIELGNRRSIREV
jgi:hypothetical protein